MVNTIERSTPSTTTDYYVRNRKEPILGSATRFSRVSSTRQYSVFGRHRPAETEY